MRTVWDSLAEPGDLIPPNITSNTLKREGAMIKMSLHEQVCIGY